MKQLLQDLLTAYKMGVKTLYYHNTRDGAADNQADIAEGRKQANKPQAQSPAEVIIEEDDDCAGGACKI
jgi:ribonucleoside-diphosphate reductase alpha chain